MLKAVLSGNKAKRCNVLRLFLNPTENARLIVHSTNLASNREKRYELAPRMIQRCRIETGLLNSYVASFTIATSIL